MVSFNSENQGEILFWVIALDWNPIMKSGTVWHEETSTRNLGIIWWFTSWRWWEKEGIWTYWWENDYLLTLLSSREMTKALEGINGELLAALEEY